ncbi:MAG: V0D/AC39 family V-type ATPase subunit [Candidatus Coproplasma sp.]
MAIDVLYTNGVIAAMEKYLLKDKILKLCETDAESALRSICDSGFGKGAEAASAYDYERLLCADEKAIDEFIREYSPSEAEKVYLLAPRDFHNAKALIKARFLDLDEQKLLAPEGLIPVSVISKCVKEEDYSPLGAELGEAVKCAAELFSSDADGVSGSEVGFVFEKALYSYLAKSCRKNRLLAKLVSAKADMTNILTALRSPDADYAASRYVGGGTLDAKRLEKLFSDDTATAAHSLDDTPYAKFCAKCFEDKSSGRAMTQAERMLESYETEYFSAKKYELVNNQPFLYYVFRRRAENENVRILFVCLLAGLSDSEIKGRLRSFS